MNERTSGSDIQSIENRRFVTISTDDAENIVKGIEQSGMIYSARFDDKKLSLVYSEHDKDRMDEILHKANNEAIERVRSYQSGESDVLSLLPEIAELMKTSVSHLKRQPYDLQERLADTYVNYWYSDSATMLSALKSVMMLDRNAEAEIEAHEHTVQAANNTPEKRKEIHEAEIRLADANAAEQAEYQEQRERTAHEQKRTAFFTRDQLKRERVQREHETKRKEQDDITRKGV